MSKFNFCYVRILMPTSVYFRIFFTFATPPSHSHTRYLQLILTLLICAPEFECS